MAQKTWYDRHAREQEFEPEEQVLVLLPTSIMLLAEWQGPYPGFSQKCGALAVRCATRKINFSVAPCLDHKYNIE